MKVKCIEIKRINKEGLYQSLTIGKEYIVLAIEFYDKSVSSFSESIGDFVLYRIKDNDGIVIPFPARIFEITSSSISLCWIPYYKNNDSFSILPKLWAREYFWDDFYNDEDKALLDFKMVEQELIKD
jgi:hypothetical protein